MRRCCAVLFILAFTSGFSQNSFNKENLMFNLKALSADSMEGRKVGTEGSVKSRSLIINQLRQSGVKPYYAPDFLQPFVFKQSFGTAQSGNGVNILAVVEGKKKETIVISAHYDHMGVVRNQIYNGADDNASGTSALLAFAEYFNDNPPEHRIIFAFFDAEEVGLKGSAHFVNAVDLKKEKVVLNVNMDMIGRSHKNELYASGTFHYPHLKKPIEDMKMPENIKLLFGHDNPSTGHDDWTSQSDQYHFHQRKIPFLYFGVEDHPDYHKPTDDFEKINTDFYTSSTETILRAIIALDKNLE